jgi:hypothetical protein
MIRDVKLGVYAVDNVGGSTSGGSFTFSAAYSYMIRNDQLAEMVRDVVLSGSAFETLMNVDMLGDRVIWGPGGMCGYNQHHPSPAPRLPARQPTMSRRICDARVRKDAQVPLAAETLLESAEIRPLSYPGSFFCGILCI